MTQHSDYQVRNQSGVILRSSINNNLQDIVTCNTCPRSPTGPELRVGFLWFNNGNRTIDGIPANTLAQCTRVSNQGTPQARGTWRVAALEGTREPAAAATGPGSFNRHDGAVTLQDPAGEIFYDSSQDRLEFTYRTPDAWVQRGDVPTAGNNRAATGTTSNAQSYNGASSGLWNGATWSTGGGLPTTGLPASSGTQLHSNTRALNTLDRVFPTDPALGPPRPIEVNEATGSPESSLILASIGYEFFVGDYEFIPLNNNWLRRITRVGEIGRRVFLGNGTAFSQTSRTVHGHGIYNGMGGTPTSTLVAGAQVGGFRVATVYRTNSEPRAEIRIGNVWSAIARIDPPDAGSGLNRVIADSNNAGRSLGGAVHRGFAFGDRAQDTNVEWNGTVWTSKADIPVSIQGHVAVGTLNDVRVMTGYSSGSGGVTRSFLYNGNTNTWSTELSTPTTSRRAGGARGSSSGSAMYFGGADGDNGLSTYELYTNRQIVDPNHPTPSMELLPIGF